MHFPEIYRHVKFSLKSLTKGHLREPLNQANSKETKSLCKKWL